jgi:hypothetical protein
MMQEDRQVVAILVLLAAIALVFACYLLTVAIRYKRALAREVVRYRLFDARDKLYLAVADGLLPVESSLFQDTRRLINFLVREGDGAGFKEFSPIFLRKDDDESFSMKDHITQLPGPARVVFLDILTDVVRAMYDLFMLNSRLARLFVFLKRTATKMDQAAAEHPVTTARRLEQNIEEVEELSVTFRSAAY